MANIFWKKLTELCEDRNISPTQACKEAGIAHGGITYWKQGKTKPGMESLRKLSNYFDVSLEYWNAGASVECGENGIKNHTELQRIANNKPTKKRGSNTRNPAFLLR